MRSLSYENTAIFSAHYATEDEGWLRLVTTFLSIILHSVNYRSRENPIFDHYLSCHV